MSFVGEKTGRAGAFIIIGLTSMIVERAWADGADLFAPSWTVGKAVDSKRALPLTSFYSTPPLQPIGKPGTLVRSEPAIEYDLPPGVTASRILYHSQNAGGKDALASGVVLVPYGKPPKDGWPLLAWSHGTSGVARVCAPSLMTSLFYNWEGLYEYVMLGYAVVATDYVGLGTEGRHAYLDMLNNGADVINSVPAARAAVPNLSNRWVAIGHSQGGLSAMGIAQLEDAIRDPNFLGTVTLAGASELEQGIDAVLSTNQPVLSGLLAFWIFGVKSLYPAFEPKNVLTAKALTQYNNSVEDGCSAAIGSFAALAPNQMFKPGWKEDKYIKQVFARNRPGAKPIYGPMLLVTGGDDILFTESASRQIFERLCAAGGQIQRNVYPKLGHDPLVYGSLRDQVDWIASRFAGKAAPSNCSSHNSN